MDPFAQLGALLGLGSPQFRAFLDMIRPFLFG
jgi:hypothetical protein